MYYSDFMRFLVHFNSGVLILVIELTLYNLNINHWTCMCNIQFECITFSNFEVFFLGYGS